MQGFILHAPPQHFWPLLISAALAAAACFLLIFRWLHRGRLLADTPTAKIRAAHQGYVELEGHARMMDGEPVIAPLSGQRCVWYRYTVEHKAEDRDDWRTVESGTSEAIFHLDDGTGLCIVDPEGADITPSVTLRWRGQLRRPGAPPLRAGFWERLLNRGCYRYTESRIREGDPLYAIGQFIALGAADPASVNDEIRDLLSRWKRDPGELLRRFDRDRDGQISFQEWEEARQQAEREVLASWHEKARESDLPLLKRPDYGRPYILSTTPQEILIARYRRNAVLAALAFLSLGSGVAYALNLRLGV